MKPYEKFLADKQIKLAESGISFDGRLNPLLFDFQRDVVLWALRKGRAAMFLDCGMGKTVMQLEFAERVPGDVLILAPLAVAQQTVREAQKFGIKAEYSRSGKKGKITVANYEMLEHFSAADYEGIVLDESSILKSFDGIFRNQIIEAFAQTPFRLACTATPAPNDYMELGNHSEFLGALSRTEMLSTFFVHDGGETSKWRLKRHAQADFWKWVCSWAVMMRKPSDLGYPDGDFILPEMQVHDISIEQVKPTEGMLFAMPAATLQERRQARSGSVDTRGEEVARLVATKPTEPWLIWCNLNSESDEAVKRIPGAVEVRGAHAREYKEAVVQWFTGQLCDKCLSQIGRGDKLAEWRANTTSEIITESTEPSESDNQTNTNEFIESSDVSISGSTCAPTIEKTERKSLPIEGSGEGKNIGTTQSTGQRYCLNGEIRSGETKGSTTGLKLNSESVKRTTSQSSIHREEDVPSADGRKRIVAATNSTLTTTTKQKRTEGFCAPTATWESENSKTIPDFLKEPRCTCGRGISTGRKLVTKSSIFGFGLNFQHCPNVVFYGLSDSYEQFYQAVRRCWRFGQKQKVNCYIVTSSNEGAVTENIKRKEREATEMAEEMVNNMHELNKREIHGGPRRGNVPYATRIEKSPGWEMQLGDAVELTRDLPTGSIHYSIFSPPFASLYTYSASERDMGNCRTHSEFYEHFRFLVNDLFRVMMAGRLVSFHCMNLPKSKERDGVIGITDFRGELIRMFEEVGFIYHSEVVIWKDPVTAMQRTKAIGLLHKQLKKDSTISRQGIPDYLVTMRKPGENPERVTHTNESFPVSLWQRYASPVWMDINPSNTLQRKSAREHEDERHICPLQLQVIQRAIELWTNPKDLVFSPFAGIGSEGYMALQEGRRFLGFELKESYFKQACLNLKAAKSKTTQMFEEASA